MRIILGDTAVSLVPSRMKEVQSVKKYLSKYHRLPIRDAAIHQHLFQSIPRNDRMDRPDILHFGLLTVLGWNKIIPEMEIYFTIKDRLFFVDPSTKLPRSQKRFYGILEILLQNKSNKSSKSMYIKEVDIPLDQLLENAIAFSINGQPFERECIQGIDTYVFGCFSFGTFQNVLLNSLKQYSLYPESLELWTAIGLFMKKMI